MNNIAQLYQEFADEDRQLAEEGIRQVHICSPNDRL